MFHDPRRLAALLLLVFLAPARAQEPPPTKPAEARKPADELMPVPPVAIPAPDPRAYMIGPIKPLPLVPIPDDPPPHEGAMIDIPYIIEPPDILYVEVLQALPGRPITGQRLVRPDGTISLGFYGELHVRGLTTVQAKVKIIHHLRSYITDDGLGLLTSIDVYKYDPDQIPPPGTKVEIRRHMPSERDIPPSVPGRFPFDLDAEPNPRKPPTPPQATLNRSRRAISVVQLPEPKPTPPVLPQPPPPAADPAMPGEEAVEPEVRVYIDPATSHLVFVDLASYNSKFYFVQGDVGKPGRLPYTGKDSVLDALNYAAGLNPTAEPTDIHIYRPARGGKPAKDYRIDFAAILKGDAKANLQVFPDDRIVVGRNPIVQKTMAIDRAAALLYSASNSLHQQSYTARAVGAAAGEMNGTTQAQREELIKEWTDFLWSISSGEGGATVNEKTFREAVMKKLAPKPTPDK